MKNLAIIDDWEHAALATADWSVLEDRVQIDVFHDHLESEDAVAARLGRYEIVCIMRERTPFPRTLLERLPKLEHLFTSGTRNAKIDLAAAKERGVVVTGAPTLPYPAAEHTWALILALAKRIPEEDRATRDGGWGQGINVCVHGKTLGVVGLGKLGARVATVGRAFGMNVVAWSQNLTEERCRELGVRYVDKETLFREADYVTIHLQLGTRNRALVGARDLALMKPTAYLINTSRGPIVEERALIECLEQQRIAGAGLDVFDVEPLPEEHPLRSMPNTVITPHQGYVVRENYDVFYQGAVRNVQSWLDGTVVNALK
jgi:phosphoglycerate dehydrogenase-like enzyme